MSRYPMARCLGPGPDPLAVAATWPTDVPLAALLSARGGSPFSRWSILAPIPRSGDHFQIDPSEADSSELLQRLDMLATTPSLKPTGDPNTPPFRGGRILVFSYELGHMLEPRTVAERTSASHVDCPIAESIESPIALVHDRCEKQWWIVGDESAHPGLEDFLEPREMIECNFPSEPLTPLLDDEGYALLVERTIEYVHAGDIFQANIARRFSARADLTDHSQRRAFAAAVLAKSGAWFGAIIELPRSRGDETIISLSPELFLNFDPTTRVLRSRPIKGTLPGGSDPVQLEQSDKDAAELAMIVDLMRNDIGRVAEPGSVRVCDARTIESHPGVIHGVADVQGTLRKEVGLGQLLKATFPPGSVSGAPKIRAMQIIEELEPVRRGLYCGALGFSSACGGLALDVSIRTLSVKSTQSNKPHNPYSHEIQYGAGCGVVAESTPEGEAAESTAKAALFAQFLSEHSNRSQPHASKHAALPT